MKLEQIFDKCKEITIAKQHDYVDNPEVSRHENFNRSSMVSGWFVDPLDRVYTTLIGIKLARLATLLNGKSPKNESIEDSFLDLVNYCALWADARTESVLPKFEQPEQVQSTVETNPNRNTGCYFCGHIVKNEKVITGRYRQAHITCFRNVNFDELKEFIDPSGGIARLDNPVISERRCAICDKDNSLLAVMVINRFGQIMHMGCYNGSTSEVQAKFIEGRISERFKQDLNL